MFTWDLRRSHDISVDVVQYNADSFGEYTLDSLTDLSKPTDASKVHWTNVTGVHDPQLVKEIGEIFNLHPLVLEDIANTSQRPKLEEFDDYAYVVAKMVMFRNQGIAIRSEQISFVLGKNYLLTFQEESGDVFEGVRKRIRESKGRIRSQGGDFLLYALLDAIIDHYFVVLERFGEELERIEDAVLESYDTADMIRSVYSVRRELVLLRKAVWPLRELIKGLQDTELKLIQKKTKLFVRNLYDHTVQVMDTIESFRDLVSSIREMHMTAMSNKMNAIMKVLTIIATIFIPLTFVAGIYGMNFEYMPELKWRLGYPISIAVMVGMAGAMVYYFKRKRWF